MIERTYVQSPTPDQAAKLTKLRVEEDRQKPS